MKGLRVPLLLTVLMLIPFLLLAQDAANSSGANSGASAAISQIPIVVPTSAIRILSPMPDAKVHGSEITVRYELQDSGVAAASSPNYRLQLDSRDPVQTLSTEHSFSGLTPGRHVLTIDVVDANGNPIAGARTQVRFMTEISAAGGSTPRSSIQPAFLQKASLPLPHDDQKLPASSGGLPLLSILGFGVLAGGMISAMRTRR